jgi:hypothetical protein
MALSIRTHNYSDSTIAVKVARGPKVSAVGPAGADLSWPVLGSVNPRRTEHVGSDTRDRLCAAGQFEPGGGYGESAGQPTSPASIDATRLAGLTSLVFGLTEA